MFERFRNFINRNVVATQLAFAKPQNNQPDPWAGMRNGDNNSILTKLTRANVMRAELSMGKFNGAISIAELPLRPQRRMLYEQYKVIAKDDEVITQTRVAANTIKRAPWSLVSESGKIDTKKKKLLQKTWFTQYLNFCVDTEWYGHSLIQFDDAIDDKGEFRQIELVPREHVRPEYGDILLSLTDTQGIPFRNNPELKYLVEVMSSPYDLGLFQAIGVAVIYKRYASKDWSVRSERFGMPILDVATTSRQKNELDALEHFAANFGTNGYFIHDENDTVTILDTKQSDGHKVYLERIKLSDSQIAKMINGQSSTSDEKSFVGAANVHERILNDFTFARMQDIENHTNDVLIPFLMSHNYALKGLRFQFDELAEKQPEKTGSLDGANPTPQPGEKKKPIVNNSENNLNSKLALHYNQDACCVAPTAAPKSTLALDDLFSRIIDDIYNERQKQGAINIDLWKSTAEQLIGGVKTGFDADPNVADMDLIQALKQNAMAFAAFKNHAQAKDIFALLVDDNGQKRTYEEFKAEALKISKDYNLNYLQTEYDTAVAAARMASRYQHIVHEHGEDVMCRYETVGDGRVRKSHQKLDGTTLALSNPFWDTFFPPNGWNCRCDVVIIPNAAPVDPTASPSQTEVPDAFRNNPAKSGEIYTSAHPVFDVPNTEKAAVIKQVNDNLAALDYDLHSTTENGTHIYVHPAHDANTTSADIAIANELAAVRKFDIKLLPTYIDHSASATVNGNIAVFDNSKIIDSFDVINNANKAFVNVSKKGIVIFSTRSNDWSIVYITHLLQTTFQDKQLKNISAIWLIKKGKLIKITRANFNNGTYKTKIADAETTQ